MKQSLVVGSLVVSLFAAPVFASQPEFAHISTTGYGEIQAKPDMAEFSVRVVQSQMDADQAKQGVDTVVDKFLDGLTKNGIDKADIQSSNLYLSPQYHYPEKGKPELIGYRASRTVTVQVMDLDKLNNYLDLALESGINQVDNIQLKVKDQGQYQEAARMAAIKDAQSKASSLAKGFDQQLGKVWRIEYLQQRNQPVVMRAMAMDNQAESNSYQDSVITIRDRVDVTYRIDD
ncbi:oxidative stress defense protein [Vibrio sp. 10N]|uniref:oxidative stress defense protein n=1 Tax=Vibrio sp. 10N TaxID=3058938 RepID=UPI00281300D0|nr:oxidative stress defense protein [Vibrio sp. 10N]